MKSLITIAGLIIFTFLIIAAVVGMWVVIEFVSDLLAEQEASVSYKEIRADAIAAEGKVMHVYRDSLGIPTGGIGHRLTPAELTIYQVGDSLKEEVVDKWWRDDYRIALMGIAKHLHDFNDYPPLAQLAIWNFAFQLGADAFDNFPRATKALQERRWADAADEWEFADVEMMRKSKWYLETPARCLQEVHRLREVAKEEE